LFITFPDPSYPTLYFRLQTVVVIPVLPHGVVQLGSFLPVSFSNCLVFEEIQ